MSGGQYGMAEALTEKLIEKMREYVFLYDTGHPGSLAYRRGLGVQPIHPISEVLRKLS
jgi:hypothetical protein